MPRTSIILMDGPGLPAALASALDQSDPDLEIVLSTAPGRECELALAGDPRVRIVASSAASFAERVNRVLAELRSPFVKLLPAGERLAPASLDVQVAALSARSDLGAVFARVEPIDADGRPAPERTVREYETPARTRDELLPALLGSLRIPASSGLMRREMLTAAGGLDPRYTRAPVDDLWLRLLGGSEGLLLHAPLVRVPAAAGDEREDAVAEAERGLARLCAISDLGIERFLACLGGARHRPPEVRRRAMLGLADLLLASRQAMLLPVASQLLVGAIQLGAVLGVGRSARFAEAGLGDFADLAAGPPSRVLRMRRGVARTLAPASSAAEAPLPLRRERRLLCESSRWLRAEQAAAEVLVDIASSARSRVASAHHDRPSPSAEATGMLVDTSARIARLAQHLLGRLRPGMRGRRGSSAPERGPRSNASLPTGGGRA